jgi:hypothetical protein
MRFMSDRKPLQGKARAQRSYAPAGSRGSATRLCRPSRRYRPGHWAHGPRWVTYAGTGTRWLGAVTPLGGLAFLLGWLLLAWAGSRG